MTRSNGSVPAHLRQCPGALPSAGASEEVKTKMREQVNLWIYATRAELDDSRRYLKLETREGIVMVMLPAEGIIEERGACNKCGMLGPSGLPCGFCHVGYHA